MAKADTEGWLVILDPNDRYLPNAKRKKDRIRFTYLHEGWSESKSAQYSATAILGRSEPVRGYMGSGPRLLNLTLAIPPEGDDFPSDVNSPSNAGLTSTGDETTQTNDPETGEVLIKTNATYQERTFFNRKQEVIDFIRSLVYPQYGPGSKVIYPPPRVLIFFGNWFSLIGIVTSWSMNHRGPFDNLTMTPHHTEVSISVEETDEPYSWNEVFDGVLSKTGFIDKHPSLSSAIE